MDAHEIDRARAALWAIPADLPREGWVKAGMAAQAAGLSLDDYDQWSAQAESFYRISTADTQDAKRKAFQRIRKDLAADGLATVANDVYRVTEPATSIREVQFAHAARYRDTGQRRDIAGTSPDHQAGQAGHVSLDMSRCPDGEPY